MTEEQEARCLALQVAGSLRDPLAVLVAADAYTAFLLNGTLPKPAPTAPAAEPATPREPKPENNWPFA